MCPPGTAPPQQTTRLIYARLDSSARRLQSGTVCLFAGGKVKFLTAMLLIMTPARELRVLRCLVNHSHVIEVGCPKSSRRNDNKHIELLESSFVDKVKRVTDAEQFSVVGVSTLSCDSALRCVQVCYSDLFEHDENWQLDVLEGNVGVLGLNDLRAAGTNAAQLQGNNGRPKAGAEHKQSRHTGKLTKA